MGPIPSWQLACGAKHGEDGDRATRRYFGDRFEIGEFLGGCNPSLKIPSKNISEASILNESSCFAPQA